MTKRIRFVTGGVALLAAALFLSTQVVAQEAKAPPKPPGEQDMAEMMAKWKELNAKGPEHEKFKDMVGNWDTVTKMWMEPGAEPTLTEGTAVFRLILDGRYIEQKFKCMMMDEPFEGRSLEGYDRFKKKFVSIWMDNSSTGIFMSEGTADETGKVCTYYGKMDDPMTGQKDKVVKSIAREIDKDHVVFEMYEEKPGAGLVKTMEISYTRKK
jgi:hypothetical protein